MLFEDLEHLWIYSKRKQKNTRSEIFTSPIFKPWVFSEAETASSISEFSIQCIASTGRCQRLSHHSPKGPSENSTL